jgi:hypothetical protein
VIAILRPTFLTVFVCVFLPLAIADADSSKPGSPVTSKLYVNAGQDRTVNIQVASKGTLTLKAVQLDKSDCGLYLYLAQSDTPGRPQREGFVYAYSEFEYSFFVKPGNYEFAIGCQTRVSTTIGFQYEIVSAQLDVLADQLSEWLSSVHLDEFVDIKKFTRNRPNTPSTTYVGHFEPEIEITIVIPYNKYQWAPIVDNLMKLWEVIT